MKLYTVVKEKDEKSGYEIMGIFSTDTLAVEYADDLIISEPDGQYTFEVRRYELDKEHDDNGKFIYLAFL